MIRLSNKRKWLFSGVAVVGALLVSLTSVGTTNATAPADPPSGPVSAANLAGGGHENSYATIAPCRILDTKTATGGNLVAGVTRNFVVGGTSGFAPQGGNSGGCNIPTNATAITASISSSSTTGNGYLRAWARGTTEPTLATTVLLVKGVQQFTGTTIPISPSGISVKAYGGNTRFVIDVTGYYIPKMYAVILSTGTFVGYSRITGLSHTTGSGFYTLSTDTDVSTCAINVSSFANYQAAGYASGSNIYVQTSNAAGTAGDFYFQVAVTC